MMGIVEKYALGGLWIKRRARPQIRADLLQQDVVIRLEFADGLPQGSNQRSLIFTGGISDHPGQEHHTLGQGLLCACQRQQGVVPLLRGEKVEWRNEWFYEHHTLPARIPPSEGVRTERWKYLRWVGAEPVVEELYDLGDDPREERNLAGAAEHAARLKALRERWAALRKAAE